ncbi:MAG: cytochrome c3 family protein [Woeseiaceae bacterium]
MVHRFAKVTFTVGVSFLLLFLMLNAAEANEVEKWLLMPGEVVASHAEFEADCSLCHSPLSDTTQGELCVDCHSQTGEDIERSVGFHGRLPADTQMDCAVCHTDHEGRDADILSQNDSAFDHSLTDFQLRGAHADLECASCHEPDTPRSDAPTQCIGCHRADDVHNGSLGEDCASCHVSQDWQQTHFDHSNTIFRLTGAHTEAGCQDCHVSENFADVGTTCVSCHQADDVHNGQNGTECGSCHVTVNWIGITFDHFDVSGFRLADGHDNLTCGACHRSESHDDLGGSSCQSCHANDDVHEGRFGNDCSSCHNSRSWSSSRFDHDTRTDFKLPPGHEQLECASCHTGKLTDPLPQDCGTCHQDNDPHQGQLGSVCEACHIPTNWVENISFDHDLAAFPLLGKHADIGCDQCHASAAFHDADSQCVSCHLEDDLHNGSLGVECESCHNPATWTAWLFDHDQNTDFALTGAHADVSCSSCHVSKNGVQEPLAQTCVSCHRRDDRHSGRFGDNCGSCHTTDSFSQIGDR